MADSSQASIPNVGVAARPQGGGKASGEARLDQPQSLHVHRRDLNYINEGEALDCEGTSWVVKILTPQRLACLPPEERNFVSLACLKAMRSGSSEGATSLVSDVDIDAEAASATRAPALGWAPAGVIPPLLPTDPHLASSSTHSKHSIACDANSLIFLQVLDTMQQHGTAVATAAAAAGTEVEAGSGAMRRRGTPDQHAPTVEHTEAGLRSLEAEAGPGSTMALRLALSSCTHASCGVALQALGAGWRDGVALTMPLKAKSSGSILANLMYLRQLDGHMHPAAVLQIVHEVHDTHNVHDVHDVQEDAEVEAPGTRKPSLAGNKTSVEKGLSILGNLPFIVTLLEADGSGAVFQNSQSLRYWGWLPSEGSGASPSAPVDAQEAPASQQVTPVGQQIVPAERIVTAGRIVVSTTEILNLLLTENLDLVPELLSHIQAGRPWRKVLQVPSTCNFDGEGHEVPSTARADLEGVTMSVSVRRGQARPGSHPGAGGAAPPLPQPLGSSSGMRRLGGPCDDLVEQLRDLAVAGRGRGWGSGSSEEQREPACRSLPGQPMSTEDNDDKETRGKAAAGAHGLAANETVHIQVADLSARASDLSARASDLSARASDLNAVAYLVAGREQSFAALSRINSKQAQVDHWPLWEDMSVLPSRKVRCLMAVQGSKASSSHVMRDNVQSDINRARSSQGSVSRSSTNRTAGAAVPSLLPSFGSMAVSAMLPPTPSRPPAAAATAGGRGSDVCMLNAPEAGHTREEATGGDDIVEQQRKGGGAADSARGGGKDAVLSLKEGEGSQQGGVEASFLEEEIPTWQDVEAVPWTDPGTGKKMFLLLQMDVTVRVEREAQLSALTETQLGMLEQMFPRHVIEFMIEKSGEPAASLATSHQGVTVLFMDIVGFTTMSNELQAAQVMGYLNSLFTPLDELIDQYEVYKVETAGDCYIVAGALMRRDEEGFQVLEVDGDVQKGAESVMAFAKALLRCAKTVTMPHNGQPTVVRVGLHTGPVVTGLIGTKLPKFGVFGDTMNTASRMESTCTQGCIQVSEDTHGLLSSHSFSSTGGVEIKGKGIMNTYLWVPEEHPEQQYTTAQEQVKEASALLRHISKQFRHRNSDASGSLFGHTGDAATLLGHPYRISTHSGGAEGEEGDSPLSGLRALQQQLMSQQPRLEECPPLLQLSRVKRRTGEILSGSGNGLPRDSSNGAGSVSSTSLGYEPGRLRLISASGQPLLYMCNRSHSGRPVAGGMVRKRTSLVMQPLQEEATQEAVAAAVELLDLAMDKLSESDKESAVPQMEYLKTMFKNRSDSGSLKTADSQPSTLYSTLPLPYSPVR